MTASEKIKTTVNKIEQNKAQYDLDDKLQRFQLLPSGNVDRYEFVTGKDPLPEGDLKKLLQSKYLNIHH